VAIVLGGLFALARVTARWRGLPLRRRRFLHVVETLALSQHAALHVVRAGPRYLVVGVAPHGVTLVLELAPAAVDAWVAPQSPNAPTTTRAAPASTASRCAGDAGEST
jgi:flagellar biogenesis protein FliO